MQYHNMVKIINDYLFSEPEKWIENKSKNRFVLEANMYFVENQAYVYSDGCELPKIGMDDASWGRPSFNNGQ